MKFRMYVSGLTAWLCLLAGGAGAQLRHGDPVVTVVNTPAVNVRSEPRVSPETFLMKVPRGAQMKRIGKREGWYHVVLPDGREAWVSGRYAEEDVARDLLEVRPGKANVRRGPSTGAPKAGTVSRGDMLAMIEKQGDWYQAILPDGGRGWIREDMVIHRPLSPPEPAASRPPPEPEPAPVKAPPVAEAEPDSDPFQEGLDYAAEKRYDEAIAAFGKAVEANPKNGAAHFELAKALQARGDSEEALKHFRLAIRGRPARPEAKFYIDAILKAQADTTSDSAEAEAPVEEGDAWREVLLTTYLLPGIAAGSLVFLVVLGLLYRRRRAARVDRPVYRRRKPDAGFDSVLKYAVEKRPLLRSIEEAERKRAEMDAALQERFEAFGKELQASGPKLPAVESSEVLLKRVEALRQTILNQEERAQIYADLVVLQNEKIAALDEEIEALKKLIQIDYRDAGKALGEKPKDRG